MTEDFAVPPAPDGTPAGAVHRSDFRPTPAAPRRTRFPRWVAVLVALGGLAVVGGVAAQVALTIRDANLTPANPGDTGRMHSAQVVSGMCLESLAASAGQVMVVDCDAAHSAEVVSSYVFTGDDWEGDSWAASTVLDYCASQLAAGGPLEAAAQGRDWVAWVPSAATWRHGDRTGLCIVTSDTPWEGHASDAQELASVDQAAA